MRESDPLLAAAALPTMMKASEALLLADPGNESKALTSASLYVMYANAFIESEAFLLPDDQFEARHAMSVRANALYRRASAILIPFIEKKAPGTFSAAKSDALSSKGTTGRLGKKDVPLMYWTAAAILAAFASDPMDFDNAALADGALAVFEKARELDPGWNGGTLHELAITLYGSLPADLGGNQEKAKAAYGEALAATGSTSPGPYVSYALSVCVIAGNKEGFITALEKALSLEGRREAALMDTLAKRKAERLLADVNLYF
jgi:predicted anti-sigma-YlaC factor YlaD